MSQARHIFFLRMMLVALALGFYPGGAAAGSLEVAPTAITLGSAKEIGILYLSNRGKEPITAQIEGFDWSQVNGEDQLTPSAHFTISPPLVQIPAGATQTVRFQASGNNPTSAEQTHRLIVSELPRADANKALGINVLLQFSVPVFIAGTATPAPSLAWDATLKEDSLIVSAHNNGAGYIKLTQVTLASGPGSQRKASSKGLFYVLSGSTRSWKFSKAGITDGEHIRIEGQEPKEKKPHLVDLVVHK